MVSFDTLIERTIVDKIIKQASEFAASKYDSIYGVTAALKTLRSNLSAIQATFRDAEGSFSGDAKSEQLKDWLMKLKDAALDAGDFLDTYATRASLRKTNRRKRNPIFSALELQEAAENIKKIESRIAEISKEKENFHFNMNPDENREEARLEAREAGPFPTTSDLYGRKEEKSIIIEWLTSTQESIEVPVLPIIGMAGLGKTTLAQFIYNDENVKGHFTDFIWLDARRDFVLTRVGRELVEFVSEMKFDVEAWSSVEKRIVEILKGKKFLLVLDDLWKADFIDWGKFQQLLQKGEKGSRVLVTSRTDEIVSTVRAHNPLFLDLMPEEECWSMFAKTAFKDGESTNQELDTIGRQIVHKCGRLPLAIVAMAHTLSSCDPAKWSRIEKDGIWETEQQIARDGKPTIEPALRLSYEHLQPHLKQCFGFCGIFPKGYEFSKIEMIKLWMAQGYVASTGQSQLDQIGGDYFDVLRSRSCFQHLNIDNKVRYKIHDLFHDLAASVSEQSCFQFEDDKPLSVRENSRHVSFLCKDVQKPASVILKAAKLRTILLPVNHIRNFGNALDKIFRTLKYLRVLDLSSSAMTELPKSIGKLILLRYLDLSYTEIRGLPNSICKLINLQTLKLLGCLWLHELPKGFNGLTSLWHLELDDMFWSKCTYLPSEIGTLTNLKNLHLFRVGRDIKHAVDQLQSMKSLTGKLHISNLENTNTASAARLKEKEDLEELVLEWSDASTTSLQDPGMQETVLEELEPHPRVKVLQICRYKGNRLPAWMANASVRNLTEASFSSCVNVKILSLGPFPHLRKLRLKGMQSLEEWPQTVHPTLSWLQISSCPKLNKLPSLLPNLRVMKIKRCDVLKDLPVAPSLMFLVLVQNTMLENWNEAILHMEETNAEGGTVVSRMHSYLNVLELTIKNCQMLRGLPHIFAPQKLEISSCPWVQALPEQNFSRRLQHLALDGCNDRTLVEAIPQTSSAYSLVISSIASLISLPVSLNLSGLKALYIHDCGDLESLSNNDDGAPLSGFNVLTLLSVRGCPKLTTLANGLLPSSLECLVIKNCLILKSFGPQNCLVSLDALRDMELQDCPQIAYDGGIPNSLKHVCVQGCPLLSRCFPGPLLPQIADLEIDSSSSV